MSRRFWRWGAVLCIAMLLGTTTAVAAQNSEQNLTIRARGDVGAEIVQVRVDGEHVIEFGVNTEWTETTVSVDASTTFDSLAVGFVNNLHNDTTDHNVFIDWVELHGERREGDSPEIWSTGKWTRDTGCTNGTNETGSLHCAGFLHFGGRPSGSTIIAHAIGTTGTENLQLQIDGVPVATRRVLASGNPWPGVDRVTAPVEFTLPRQIDHGRIRLRLSLIHI